MEFAEDIEGLIPKFGAIFMSNSATKKECLKRKIFGLPWAMANFVKQVKSGMILFLFEYEKRELYGVFQATSDGTMNLKPQAFTSSGKQYPAQVQIAPIWSCRPLSEVVFRDAIEDNYYSPNKFHFGLSEQQVHALLHLFYSRRLNNRIPDFHWTRKRKINDDGRFRSRDASESEVLDNWPSWHATSADCSGDTLGTINSVADSAFLSDSRFSTEHVGNSLIGLVGADREPLMIEDRFKSVHNVGNCIEPDFLNSRFSNEYIGKSLIGLVGADREPLMMEDRPKSVHNFGDSIEPDFLPVFPSYITLSEDDVANDYRFSKDDGVENACDVESCIRPNFPSGLVSNDTLLRTVPYDPEFPDIKYQCPSQILNSAQDLSSHQVHHLLPLSTSKCVPHEAALGSLYSEAPVVKASVFSRLSVAPRTYKKEDKGIHDEDGRLASIDEIMDSLHQAHNCWVKGKPSVRPKSRYVYVQCKEESEFPNQSQSEQPVVAKERATDVDCFLEEDSDIVWKETRVVDFKRRSKKNKVLDDMASKVSAGTSRTCKTSVDAKGEDLAGKAGKTRKLIRPDFRKKQLSHESTQNSPSALNEATAILGKFDGREKIDEINSQDHKEVTEVGSGANECEQKSSLQNRVNLSIQDLVSGLSSGSSAQEQPSYINGITAVPKNLEEKENADINHQVGNGDTLEQKCSLQS